MYCPCGYSIIPLYDEYSFCHELGYKKNVSGNNCGTIHTVVVCLHRGLWKVLVNDMGLIRSETTARITGLVGYQWHILAQWCKVQKLLFPLLEETNLGDKGLSMSCFGLVSELSDPPYSHVDGTSYSYWHSTGCH